MSGQNIKSDKYLNSAYLVELKTALLDKSNKDYLDIIGYLPETLSFNLTASWNNMLKDMFSGDWGNSNGGLIQKGIAAAQAFERLAGMRTAYSQISSWPTWEGTEPIEFTIPFRFDAVRNTMQDVVTPWVNLQKLVCPTRDTSANIVFKAPGPQISIDPASKKPIFDEDRVLSLKIGRFIYIKGVIVTAISNTLYSKFDIDGNPIQAQADVTLRTIFSPTTEDIANWFSGSENYYQLDTAINGILDDFKKNPLNALTKVSGLDSAKKMLPNSISNLF